MEVAFCISFCGVAYAYFGYPLVLILMGFVTRSRDATPLFAADEAPGITLLIPAHNEADVIGRKLDNSLSLHYPGELRIVVVSDGSTDATSQIVDSFAADDRLMFVDLPVRKGKANALNHGVAVSTGEIIVFSDASILLEEQAVWELVRPFADAGVGCVSGEDRIEGGGGEGLYGRYELFLRRQESKLGSIVGASGSIYAQRSNLVKEFPEGVAPDFLSVLNTVQSGYRAISTPKAVGYMTAIADLRSEFKRKVRTVIRGMTALFQKKELLNPFRHSTFSLFLLSHKIMRWYVPIFLVVLLVTNCFLLDQMTYRILLMLQASFYLSALLAYFGVRMLAGLSIVRVALYFTVSNAAILLAWIRYFRGVRQEIWGPSKRAV